jgi:hypothetical protein
MRIKGMRLRIAPITWHARYRYTIGGLRVNGKRRRLFFETAREAEQELRNLQIKARRQGQAGIDMPDALRAMAVECAERLSPFGKTLADATAFYLAHLGAAKSERVKQVVDAYLRSKERNRLSARHLRDIRARLGRFVESFGERPVRTITAAEVEEWLFGLGELQAQTLVNWRAILHAFFRWLLKGARQSNSVLSMPSPNQRLSASPQPFGKSMTSSCFSEIRHRSLSRHSPSEASPDSGPVRFSGLIGGMLVQTAG